jgi:hypothetical protein
VRRIAVLLWAAALAAVFAPGAGASRSVRFGIQDDAWLRYGPGTLEQRLTALDRLGVDVYRYTLHWDELEPREGAYRWKDADTILHGLQAHGIQPLVTLYGTPRWANGGRAPNVVPQSAASFAAFARAAATRYTFVRMWTVWNEPNQRASMSPVSARVYVRTLLNPAFAAIHGVIRGARVAGGVTAPRGNTGGIAPLAFVQGMRAAHARLDAYAHHPYPSRPGVESPSRGACKSCADITMANVQRLIDAVTRAFGKKPIWLTEYGYQTNPPDSFLGVSKSTQARYIGESAYRAYSLPRVELLIHFLVRDEPQVARWQSGLFDRSGVAKPAASAFPLPLVQVARRGTSVTLWGQVRPGHGAQGFRLQIAARNGRFLASAAKAGRTDARGIFRTTIRTSRGSLVRLCSADGRCGWPVLVR